MKFFVLKNPHAGRGDAVTDFLPADGMLTGEAPRCHACGKFVALRPLLPPVHVELECWGTSWGDIAFGPGLEPLISERFKDAAAEAGLTGFSQLVPVTVSKIGRRWSSSAVKPPNYWLATIVTSRALVDDSASGLERGEGSRCPACGLGAGIKRFRRIVLQPDTWSGEDVFVACGLPGTIIATEGFKAVCESAQLANCVFVDAKKFSVDFYPRERSG